MVPPSRILGVTIGVVWKICSDKVNLLGISGDTLYFFSSFSGSLALTKLIESSVFDSGKYSNRNFWARSSHVVIDPVGREFSHALALSLKEKGNIWRRIASFDTPFSLKVSQISRKFAMWECGSSSGLEMSNARPCIGLHGRANTSGIEQSTSDSVSEPWEVGQGMHDRAWHCTAVQCHASSPASCNAMPAPQLHLLAAG
ncbi:hypothetical protein L1987_20015 [Smallanthus sonchifolius]|uniref:Uncharacterized protein n=1 Tax=Smallanthus sonchifolius TaxID=185202 RepID=A0ACB9IRW9_9ASTR|nr:hypothetical protein L1987_20015 [Smallanthus sonchifolius]